MNLITMILGAIGSVLLCWSYVPQILQIIRTENVEGISTSFWIILTCGLVCILVNMVLTKCPYSVLFTQILNVALAITTLVLVRVNK